MMSDSSAILEGLPSALIIILVCFVVAAGLWYLAIRFRRSQLKIFAVAIVAMPALAFGFQICSHLFGWTEPPDFVTTTPGPPSREASAIREFPFPVPNPEFPHQIELTPRSPSGQQPAGSIPLHFIVRSPNGDVLAEKQATLAPGTGRDWLPLRAEFQPAQAGEYLLHLDIPTGVESVKVRVHELRKR
jgi:hypothetical protein